MIKTSLKKEELMAEFNEVMPENNLPAYGLGRNKLKSFLSTALDNLEETVRAETLEEVRDDLGEVGMACGTDGFAIGKFLNELKAGGTE